VLTDDDVEPGNRVTLSATARDEHGPVPRVELRAPSARSRRTRANRAHLAALAARVLRAAGARDIYQPEQPPLLFHIHSTMRMGAHERDSVLDPHAESRAVTRLFIADNSALSNALGGPYPDAHHAGARHPHRGAHLHPLLPRRKLGPQRQPYPLDTPERHPRHARTRALTKAPRAMGSRVPGADDSATEIVAIGELLRPPHRCSLQPQNNDRA
jgi:hypothetical protein